MKKTLSVILALAMVLALIPAAVLAAESSFPDTAGEYGEDSIERWAAEDVLRGFDDGAFHPNQALRRCEAMVIFERLLVLEDEADITDIEDLGNNSGWYSAAMAKTRYAGIFDGVAPHYMAPEEGMTREMLIATLARALGVKEADTLTVEKLADYDAYVATNPWGIGLVNAMLNLGVIKGKGYGDGTSQLDAAVLSTRQEFAVMLDRIIGEYITTNGKHDISGKGELFTLVVAKDVQLTGAYNGYPIVLYGKDGKVSMTGVTGTATVNVMVSGVTVTGAAAGTVFVTGPKATGLTVNGVRVSEDTTYVVPTGSSGNTPVGPGPGGEDKPEPEKYEYDITYKYNYPQGVTGQPADETEHLGPSESKVQTFTTKTATAPTGYTFINWVDQDGVGYDAGVEYETDKDLTLTAQWVSNTDYIAKGVSGAITAFNEKYKDFETLSGEGYTLSVSQIAYNSAVSANNTTREQKLLISATLNSDIAEQIITVACRTAANFLDTGELDTTDAEGIVQDVLDALKDIGITSFRDRAALKKQLTAAVKEGAGVVSGPFKNYQTTNYCFTEATVEVGGETVKVTTNSTTASVVGSKRDAVVKLATAIAKDLYNDLSQYTATYTNEVTLTAKVGITFDPTDENGDEFPTKYPFDVTLTLNGDDLVSVKWDETEKVAHLRVDAAAGDITGAYENPETGVPSIINGLLSPDAIQNSMSGSKDNIFTQLAKALESLDVADEGKGDEMVNEALEAWVKANTDALLTPDYAGDYINTAFEELVKDIADAAAEKFAEEMTNGDIPEILLNALTWSSTPENLLDLVEALDGNSFGFDFSALNSLDPAIRDYIFDAICQEIHTDPAFPYTPEKDYEGEMKSALQTNVKTQVNSALESTGLNEVLPILSKLKTLKGAASLTLGNFKTLVSNKTVQDMAPEGVTAKVPTIKNALNRLPDNATVTVEVKGKSYTLSTDDLKGLNEKGLVKGFQDLVTPTNEGLKLNDFDTEGGLKVTLNYKDSRHFTFYLEIDGLK